jgi:hypothetical protein
MPDRLPLDVQTIYAELVEHLTALEAQRTLGSISGTFVTKTVKGNVYAYLQCAVGGMKRQLYLGPYDENMRRLEERHRSGQTEARADRGQAQRLCAMLRQGGALAIDTTPARVLRALADSGVFRLGGMLVGTYAFTVLGNVLGIRWQHAALRTHDIDVASDLSLGIAVPNDLRANVPNALERLEMGFLPVPPLNLKDPSTSFGMRRGVLRVDLLTVARRANETTPVFLPQLNASAMPLRFLDYLIEEPVRAAVVDGGGVLVNVPAPARFALHKLVVVEERGVAFAGKAEKDLSQAAQVLRVLAEDRPGDIRLAWEALQRKAGAIKRAMRGVARLRERALDAYEALRDIVPAA